MTKQVLISILKQGNNGNEILSILDAISSDFIQNENTEVMPTLDEIKF